VKRDTGAVIRKGFLYNAWRMPIVEVF